jgi:hypothetical protein
MKAAMPNDKPIMLIKEKTGFFKKFLLAMRK